MLSARALHPERSRAVRPVAPVPLQYLRSQSADRLGHSLSDKVVSLRSSPNSVANASGKGLSELMLTVCRVLGRDVRVCGRFSATSCSPMDMCLRAVSDRRVVAMSSASTRASSSPPAAALSEDERSSVSSCGKRAATAPRQGGRSDLIDSQAAVLHLLMSRPCHD
eukprot:scaffold156144_cov44-Prasinocladus_malaysianus.AAC.2